MKSSFSLPAASLPASEIHEKEKEKENCVEIKKDGLTRSPSRLPLGLLLNRRLNNQGTRRKDM